MTRKLLFGLIFMGSLAVAQQTPSFNLTVSGEKTWTIWFGLGSASLLSTENLTPGQPSLTQTLRAEIEGKALEFLTLKANFNDQLGVGFQELLLTVDRPPWKAELGRFVVGAEGEGLGVYNKRVLGARAGFSGDGVGASALVTRLEGISETRTFRGEQGFAEVLYTVDDPDQPWLPAPYPRCVEGLAYWPLRFPFVEDLSEAKLRVDGGAALWSLLADWGLGYLQEDLAAELATPLTGGEFVVVRDNGHALALRIAPAALARKRILDAIDAHNTRLGLTGKDRKAYPLVEGSELETRFLSDLARFMAVLVDEDTYPFLQTQRRQYLALGERDVIEETVKVDMRLPGETAFRPSTDPDLAAFQWTLFPAEGILRIAFPDEFFASGAVRVAYAYRREGGAFMLGPSVVPGSERVSVNGKSLARGVDYTVDYAAGMLLLFSPLKPEDELVVDFERQRGGLGGYTEYERNLFGLVVAVPGWDGFRLAAYRSQDFGAPGPTTHTMPNIHSVVGVSLAGQIAGWAYRLSIAGSENVFPAGDNARAPSPNRVNAIAAAPAPDGEYVVFAHQNGVTVHKDGTFTGYGTGHGLSGRAAYSVLPLPGQLLVGTDSGLTVVRLTESSPFDRVRSWVRLSQADGVPGISVVALAYGGGRVFLATDADVASFSPADAETPKRWQKLSLPEGEARPTALLWVEARLYLGTARGLFVHTDGHWSPAVEAAGAIHALAARGRDVYAASDEGIRILRAGIGAEWVVRGSPVYGMAFRDGKMWYTTGDALWQEGDSAPTVRGGIVAVGAGANGVWAGGEADDEFRLDLWRVGETPERFTQSRTKLDGRDLARFRDVPASEHTSYGATGSLTLDRTVGDWKWELRLASRMPGYEEIGRSGRSDSHGLGFTARYAGNGTTTLELRGRWDVIDWASRPRGRLAAGLDWRWSDGPTAFVSLTPTFTGDGPASLDRLEMGWQAGLSNKTQAWSWGITASGTLRHPELAAAGQLGATISLRPRPGWTTDLSWDRPFRTTGAPGEETFRSVIKWTAELDRVSLNATWQESLHHHLTADTWSAERTIQGDGRWKPWSISDSTVTPWVSADLRISPADQRWTVRVETDIARAPVTLRLRVTAGQGYHPVTERSDKTLALSFSWDHSGWEDVRTALQWDRSWTTLSHPRYLTETTEKEEATLRITWEPRDLRWRNTLSLIWKPQEESLSVTNRLTWPLGTASLAAETSAQLKADTLDVKTRVQLGLPLDVLLKAIDAAPVGEAWGISAEAGHVVEVKPTAGPRHALFMGVTLAVRF